MSEFKYACPVCGQHIRCDSSQAGSVMDCPTCFQKITVPQAPADADSKFILTGSKFVEKKIPDTLARAAAAAVVAPEKSFPLGVVLGLALVLAAAAGGVFIYRAQHAQTEKPGKHVVKKSTGTTNAAPPKPLAAPPASDANWMLALGTNAIPDAPVAGRIHGQDFIVERALFQNGSLTLRQGARGPVEFGVQIAFGGAQPEALAGKNLNILADTNKAAKVTLHWKDDSGAVQKVSWDINYAMRLELGDIAKGRLPGKIYLCTPDPEKSYLLGSFSASISKPKPKPASATPTAPPATPVPPRI